MYLINTDQKIEHFEWWGWMVAHGTSPFKITIQNHSVFFSGQSCYSGLFYMLYIAK